MYRWHGLAVDAYDMQLMPVTCIDAYDMLHLMPIAMRAQHVCVCVCVDAYRYACTTCCVHNITSATGLPLTHIRTHLHTNTYTSACTRTHLVLVNRPHTHANTRTSP